MYILCVKNHLPFLFDDDDECGDNDEDGCIAIKYMKVIFVSTFLWRGNLHTHLTHAYILLHV